LDTAQISKSNLDWRSLVAAAKLRDLQNRLGFVISLARRVAEKRGEQRSAQVLREQENALSRSRLFFEDTLCDDGLTQVEKRWLEANRPDEAKYWRVLTDDLALSKLERNAPRDREDFKHLAQTIPLDLNILQERYREELRPYLGNPRREDLTPKLWIETAQEQVK
jgi:hypothetical protein